MLIILTEELEKLSVLRLLDKAVFNYLAKRVNFESGLIGKSPPVSYGGIALDLSETPEKHQGRAKETLDKFTSRSIKSSVSRLVKVGLFERLSGSSKGDNLILKRVFWTQWLDMENCDLDKVGQKLVDSLSLRKVYYLFENNKISYSTHQTLPEVCQEVGPTTKQQCQQQVENSFAMMLDWKPTTEDLERILHMSGGFKISQIDPFWQSEFISYWWGNPSKRLSQQQWTAKLATQLIRYLKNPKLFGQLHGLDRGDCKPTATKHGKQRYPDWAQIPKNDNNLVSWMQKNGYGDPPIGFDYHQLRQWLVAKVESRLKQVDRQLLN